MTLLRQLAAAMPSGGVLAVLEPLAEPASSGSVSADAFYKIFSLNLFHGRVAGPRRTARSASGWRRPGSGRSGVTPCTPTSTTA